MFDIGFEKLLVLALVALFVVGPERLPAAAASLGAAIRRVKRFAADASAQIRTEVGPELDQLRGPIEELRAPLRELRELRDPRKAVLSRLLDDPPARPATGRSQAGVRTVAGSPDESPAVTPPVVASS